MYKGEGARYVRVWEKNLQVEGSSSCKGPGKKEAQQRGETKGNQ
jgi:hypothetical protein